MTATVIGAGGRRSMIVVVGFNGSVASARAARYSVTLAARHGGHLLAVEVFDPESSLGWAPLAATGDADVLDALREAIRQDFAEIVGDIPLDWQLHQVVGSPLPELATIARAARADVLIVGAPRRRLVRPARSLAIRLLCNGLFPIIVIP